MGVLLTPGQGMFTLRCDTATLCSLMPNICFSALTKFSSNFETEMITFFYVSQIITKLAEAQQQHNSSIPDNLLLKK